MNGIPHLCAVALLVTVMPMAAAQSPAQVPPPSDPPKAGQPQDEPAKNSPKSSQVKEEVDQAVDAFRTYSADRRDEAVANARRAAEDLDRQMEQLQEQMDQRWGRMSQAARTRSQATMADLRKRRNAMAEWYGGMRHSSTAAWGEVRVGFVKSYHELADAMRKARTEFEQDDKDRAADEPQREDKP